MGMALTIALALAFVVVLLLLRGAPELARLEVRDGQPRFVKGRLPPKLLEEFSDVLRRRAPSRATIRIILDGGVPRVTATGVSEEQLQQLRNLAGTYSAAQFRSGRAPRG
jgi:hypothetical protein